MKRILLFVVFLMVQFGFGQTSIWTNPITGTNPNTSNPYTTGDVKNANITVSGIRRGSGILGVNTNNSYNATGWSSNVLSATQYFEFTLTPNSCKEIDFVSFVVNVTRDDAAAGPRTFELRSSIDNYATTIGTSSSFGFFNWTASKIVDLSSSIFQNISIPITFRFYAYGTIFGGFDNFSVNDFTFNGTVGNLPTPAVPTVAVTAPTCSSAATNILSTYSASLTYTSTPTGLTVGAGGVITGGTTGTSYTIRATNASGCFATSASFTYNGGAILPTPSAPLLGTITQPTCAVATGSVVLNGLPSGNWIINPGNIPGNTTSTTITNLAVGTTFNFTVTNAVGCTSTASANVVINAQQLKTWTGATNTDWHTDSNWSPSDAPTASDCVVIPNVTNKPVVTSTA